MSDYQMHSSARDLSDPRNAPDWDGEWDCPECGGHCVNLFAEDKPIIDCLDHVEDADVRGEARERIGKLMDLLEAIRVGLDEIKSTQGKIDEGV